MMNVYEYFSFSNIITANPVEQVYQQVHWLVAILSSWKTIFISNKEKKEHTECCRLCSFFI
jgi:ASC-1-like (ASCH) protein